MGALGPTNRTASISPDAADPGARNVTFDELAEAYQEAAEGLIAGGADLLVIETIFDTLNAKAAIFGVEAAFDARRRPDPAHHLRHHHRRLRPDPLGPDRRGVLDLGHARPPDRGRAQLRARRAPAARAHRRPVADRRDLPISAYPNAGLPNEFGGYDEGPSTTAELLGQYARDGLINIAGGCCGTTPAHVRAIAEAVAGVAAAGRSRSSSARPGCPGLQALTIPQPGGVFVNVGERTNVTGSRKFAKLDPRGPLRRGRRGRPPAGGRRAPSSST